MPCWASYDAVVHDTESLPLFYARVVDAVRVEAATLRIFLEPTSAVSVTIDPQLDLAAIDRPYLVFSPPTTRAMPRPEPAYLDFGREQGGVVVRLLSLIGRMERHELGGARAGNGSGTLGVDGGYAGICGTVAQGFLRSFAHLG